MNLKTIQDLSYKDKKMLVAEVCLMYKKLRTLKNLNLSVNGNVLKDVNSSQKIRTKKTVSILESIFSLLDAEQAIVIENDFINKQANG